MKFKIDTEKKLIYLSESDFLNVVDIMTFLRKLDDKNWETYRICCEPIQSQTASRPQLSPTPINPITTFPPVRYDGTTGAPQYPHQSIISTH